MTRERHYDNSEWPEWIKEAWSKGSVEGGLWQGREDVTMFCGTREGVVFVTPDDFIIQGVEGELYPCKPEIFWETYDPADEEAQKYWHDHGPPELISKADKWVRGDVTREEGNKKGDV